MNQYERMVSYLYSYKDGEKMANVGYAKVEKRGTQCRIMVQMRAVVTQNAPCVYLYRQEEDGIRTILIGKMYARGTNLVCKSETKREDLFNTGKSIEDMDGIYIDIQSDLCFDTTWKKDYFYKGVPKEYQKETMEGKNTDLQKVRQNDHKEMVPMEKREIPDQTMQKQTERPQQKATMPNPFHAPQQEPSAMSQDQNKTSQNQNTVTPQIQNASAVSEQTKPAESVSPSTLSEQREENDIVMDSAMARKIKETAKEAAQGEIQMQSVCNVCPFKDHTMDYGQKILCSFPAMHPFCEGVIEGCVRIEPKDIGCLPMSEWSLSGNRFLLHGYYCYRHLIFVKGKDQRYYIGVPGIYHEKEKKQAKMYGFCEFLAIGDFEKTTGAFGYWVRQLVKV